jgi:hypothetical protein
MELMNSPPQADGRTLSVYMKPGGYMTAPTGPRAQRTNETRLAGNSVLVDGSMGFNDVMDTDDTSRRLYSDELVSTNQPNGDNGDYYIDVGSRRDRNFMRGR